MKIKSLQNNIILYSYDIIYDKMIDIKYIVKLIFHAHYIIT